MDHPERRYTQKCVTPKPNFGFGVRFSSFLASQHRGGRLRKILKAIWKPNRVYTLLGISFLIQRPTVRPPHPKMWYSKREIGNFPFGVRFSPFLASQHRGGQLGKILKAFWKPNRVYTLLGISFLIQQPTAGPPHPKMGYSESEFRFRSKIFALFGISAQGGST